MDRLNAISFEYPPNNENISEGTMFDPNLILPSNSSVEDFRSFGFDESNKFHTDPEQLQQIEFAPEVVKTPNEVYCSFQQGLVLGDDLQIAAISSTLERYSEVISRDVNLNSDNHLKTATISSTQREAYENISSRGVHLYSDNRSENINIYSGSEVLGDRISNAVHDGPYGFQMELAKDKDLQYSPKLGRLYIKMNGKFTLSFKVDNKPDQKLNIRVTPAFEDPKNLQELVHRCPVHMNQNDPLNAGISEHIIQHVLRTKNEEAQYVGNKNFNKRLSIVFPLRDLQAGEDDVRELFYFVCNTSCANGMNRRLINLICTLETENGKILGRQVLKIKICENLKRDRKHDEEELTPKKRRKLSDRVEQVFTISIDIGDEKSHTEFNELLKPLKNKFNIRKVY